MKHIAILSKMALGLLALSAFFLSCEKDLPTQADYTDYLFDGVDPNGGNWKPVLLSSADQIAIPAPEEVTSAAYQAELAAVLQATSSISSADQAAIDYWTNNPALRWNEIALELIAKYNLIPGPNDDGTYPVPDPANPGATPNFPFAHPPYAVRALAYLGVAQFDGLITAWHYKFQYNRPAPYKTNAAIPAAYTDNLLPSYPSDGAAIAAASRDILSAMFPLEKDYLAQKAAEHMSSLIKAGENVQSDIDAGSFIGAEAAKVALNRAKTDGMSKAQCPKPVADSIRQAAFDRFGWKWENLEVPPRPVGLAPLYGQVKMWNVANVESVRPAPPPAIGSPEYERDKAELIQFANNMTDEWRAIANFWQDGIGTYTPPGHWNRIAKDYIIRYQMNPLRTARTFAYLNIAMMDAGISCWDAKYYYHYPRPINLIENFKTIAGTPNFPSYTSGHSVFSASGAEVLAHIFPTEAALFRDWAKEAALSRVYGGIHWRFDAEVGTAQGILVAGYTLQVAQNDGAE
ncbi:MAG: phosphatase PAP2 family protein [Saprospiraceae bacterium]|nr:phosphatase PAP2 family protein [Saprospiraceae bacterium]